MRSCRNCKKRFTNGMFGIECCMGWEMATTEKEEKETAEGCPAYRKGDPECYEEEHYCPSATAGDYSPSCPWNAPGMSVMDFI